jgi:hypothetical protein
MCVCVCVCMYVCVSGGLPLDPHKPSPRNLAWAPHFTLARHRARGQPQMLTPWGTPYSDPVWKTLKGKELGGGQQKKVAPQGRFEYIKKLWGAHPNLGPAGSTLPNGGVCFENWARASKQKLLLGVGLNKKNLFVGGSPQPKARRVLRSICTGLFHNEIVK